MSAGEGDLFLRRRKRVQVEIGAISGEQLECFERNKRPNPIVHASGDAQIVGEVQEIAVDDGRISSGDPSERVGPIGRADVDPEIFGFDSLFAIFWTKNVTGLPSNHAKNVPVVSGDADALSDQYLGIPTADRIEPEVSLGIDVGDQQSDFVDVPFNHDNRRTLCLQPGVRIAEHIVGYFAGERFGMLSPNACGGRFVTGWARQIDEPAQKVVRA